MRELSRRVRALEMAAMASKPAAVHDWSAFSDRGLELLESAADWCIGNPNAGGEAAVAHLDALFAEAGLRLHRFERDGVTVWQDYPLADAASATSPEQVLAGCDFPHRDANGSA